jgi:hypothetical protein
VWNIRPVVPRGGSGTVVWMRGGYRGWRAYATSITLRATGDDQATGSGSRARGGSRAAEPVPLEGG